MISSGFSREIRLPDVPSDEQVEICKKIIGRYQAELLPLRQQVGQTDEWRRKAKEWEEKYNKLRGEMDGLIKEIEKWKKEQDKLKKQIERLTQTNKRYEVALFDHGNFKRPDEQGKKKPKGGQYGHTDTNRERYEDYSTYERKRIHTEFCYHCHASLRRTESFREKILIDIVLTSHPTTVIVESERQWCSGCHTEVIARHPQALPFTEYGMNIFMMVLVYRFQCHSSLSSISSALHTGYGVYVSKSEIANILKTAKEYLRYRYDKLIEEVRQGRLMYNDETGWTVRGQQAWMWIMATEDTTVYYAAESRGKGIMEDMYGSSQAYSMHDGLLSYMNSIPTGKQMYCWAHILRFAYEETVTSKKNSKAIHIRDQLVDIFHLKRNNLDYSEEQLRTLLTTRLDTLLKLESEEEAVHSIQERLRMQKQGLMNAILYSPDGTNNLAERELRPMAIARNISYGSDTYHGMETTAVLASIVRTLAKQTDTLLLPALHTSIRHGIQSIYPHYLHIPFFDDS